jgi:hypothetical protein
MRLCACVSVCLCVRVCVSTCAGVPYIELDAQGRARPAIANLYNWRYKALGNMAHVTSRPDFVAANAGFAHEFQVFPVVTHILYWNSAACSPPGVPTLCQIPYIIHDSTYFQS